MSNFFKLNRYPIHDRDSINKRIYNTVRVSESEYAMNKASLTVQHNSRDENNLNWNQMSDRLLKANSLRKVNTFNRNSNSRTSSLTRLRPGSLTPGGYGVDIKHNSYARYLARKKGKTALKQEKNYVKVDEKAVTNNKLKKFNIVSSTSCECNNEKFELTDYNEQEQEAEPDVEPEPEPEPTPDER